MRGDATETHKAFGCPPADQSGTTQINCVGLILFFLRYNPMYIKILLKVCMLMFISSVVLGKLKISPCLKPSLKYSYSHVIMSHVLFSRWQQCASVTLCGS